MTPGKYFVGGVAGQTTAETLRAYFSQYGEIEDSVVMMRDGRPRGFGFVTFKNPDAIPPSLTGSTHTIDGKQVNAQQQGCGGAVEGMCNARLRAVPGLAGALYK